MDGRTFVGVFVGVGAVVVALLLSVLVGLFTADAVGAGGLTVLVVTAGMMLALLAIGAAVLRARR